MLLGAVVLETLGRVVPGGRLCETCGDDPTWHVGSGASKATCQVVERRLQPRTSMQDASEQKRYVLVIKNRRLALGPFA